MHKMLGLILLVISSHTCATEISIIADDEITTSQIHSRLLKDHNTVRNAFLKNDLALIQRHLINLRKNEKILLFERKSLNNECADAYSTLSALALFYSIILEVIPKNESEIQEGKFMRKEGERMYAESKTACEIHLNSFNKHAAEPH